MRLPMSLAGGNTTHEAGCKIRQRGWYLCHSPNLQPEQAVRRTAECRKRVEDMMIGNVSAWKVQYQVAAG